MTTQQQEQIVKTAVARFKFTASAQNGLIVVRDNKGRVAGTVSADGSIERKYAGAQALMGALIRDAINIALRAEQARLDAISA
jgi:hypothetical protein